MRNALNEGSAMSYSANSNSSAVGPEFSPDELSDSPFVVNYEMTRRCDLSSSATPAPKLRGSYANELSAEQSRVLVDQLTDFPRPPALLLSGGDPLKRGDLISLIEYSAHRRVEVGG